MDATPELNPYAAPKATDRPRSSRPPDGRARLARTLLLAQAPLCVVTTFGYLVWVSSSADMRHVDLPRWVRDTTGLALWISGMVELATAVVFLSWLHTSYARATSIIRDARYSPMDSVAGWFIPIVNLWQPFLVMKELWQLSRGGASWRDTSPPRYITAWWVSYLLWLGSTLASLALRFADMAPTSTHRLLTGGMSAVGTVLTLCALFWAVRFVREIDAMQREGSGRD